MNDPLTQMLVSAALALVLAECTEVSPWLARRILRLAARTLGNPEATERYEAEWLALLDERPGKLLKVVFASWIALRGTWTLRAIHRPTVSAPESPSGQAAESSSEAPNEPPADGSQQGRPRRQPAGELRGVYVAGHYRRPSWLGRSRRRRSRTGLPGILVLFTLITASWNTHLGKTADSPTEIIATSVALAGLGLAAWIYCAMTMKRVRVRLAAGSFRKEDWALRVMRVPDGSTRCIRKAIADGEMVHIVIPGRSANVRYVMDVLPLSGLAVVLRPRHRRRSRR